MSRNEIHAVTGAFGFSGKYIARRLLDRGYRVKTLTDSVHRKHPFGDAIEVHPFHFDEPKKLEASLKDVRVLYNTYWVRFNSRDFGFSNALKNTRTLFAAAKAAGVSRIVHISITNPSESSRFEYFRGKAKAEKALARIGVSRAVLRPAVLFGSGDILINNIAWALRRFPVFAVFGGGNYRLQPIHVNDLAELAVRQGQMNDDTRVNAIGPETFTYRELVEKIGAIIGKPRPIVPVPPMVGWLAGKLIGVAVGDVFITRDEIQGLMAGLLAVDAPPAGKTRLTDWVRVHSDSLGRRYASELARRTDRIGRYTSLEG